MAAALSFVAGPALAQTDESIPARAHLLLGPFDASLGDWTIRGVELTGDLREGKQVAVQLLAADGSLLSEGESAFSAPSTTIIFDPPVPVGDVASVGLAQEGFAVATAPAEALVTPAEVPQAAEVPQVAEVPQAAPEVRSETITIEPRKRASSAVEDVISRGVTSAPRLAVSLIMLLVVFALVFRLPLLPIGSQARWRR